MWICWLFTKNFLSWNHYCYYKCILLLEYWCQHLLLVFIFLSILFILFIFILMANFSFFFSKLQSSGRRRRWVITFFFPHTLALLPVLSKQLELQLSETTYWHICIPLWHSYGLWQSLVSILLQVSVWNVPECETNILERSAGLWAPQHTERWSLL